MENRIKALRDKLCLTQKELANLAGTSQQQIQRIETGQLAARLELAARIAKALNSTVAVVFPGSTRALGKFKKQITAEPLYLPSEETYSELAKTGVEADGRFWIFRVHLRGQKESIDLDIEPEEKRRLFQSVQREQKHDSGLSFAVFDSGHCRVAINLAHVLWCQFVFENFDVKSEASDPLDSDEARLYFAGLEQSVSFNVDMDRGHLEDDHDIGCFRNIFYFMDTHVDADQRFYFEDGEGEDIFVRAADLALLRVPLWIVDSSALESERDDDCDESPQNEPGAP